METKLPSALSMLHVHIFPLFSVVTTYTEISPPKNCIVSNMSSNIYTCLLCSFQVPAKPLLLSHLRLAHSNDPRFSVRCGIDGCCYTAKKFSSLYSHIYRKHRDSGYITHQYAMDYIIHAGINHKSQLDGIKFTTVSYFVILGFTYKYTDM